jgi:hypothetical protein
MGYRGLGAGAEKRVDKLREGIPKFTWGNGAVIAQEETVNVREFVALLGRKWATKGWADLVGRFGEELACHPVLRL